MSEYIVAREALAHGLDDSRAIHGLVDAVKSVSIEMTRPSVLYRPRVFTDSGSWIALLGPNIEEGVIGRGNTPAEAMAAFDKAWNDPKGSAS